MTDQALARLRDRAGQNDPEALYRLAMLHIDGDGVPEDNDLAAALLFRAAWQDHAAALRRFRLSAAQDYPYARQALEALSAGAENAVGRPIE